MTQLEFLEKYKQFVEKASAIVAAKNADYSKGEDAFRNFQLVEYLGVTSTGAGILVRICDKLARISNLLKTEVQVKDESVEDTLIDLANYSLILAVWLSQPPKDALGEAVRDCVKGRHAVLEGFCKAYLEEKGIKPSEARLCEKVLPSNEHVWWFESNEFPTRKGENGRL